MPLQAFTYAPCGDLIAKATYTNGTDAIVESYAYDMFGNRTATTDALGNTVFKSYDPFGRVVAEWGATYPVRFSYDTQGRRTSLSTTRDGNLWDTTTWAYDASTGLCLSKTYADGSTITYTYTPDDLLLRTTYASGRWKENSYDASRRLVAETSGGAGGSPADTNTFTYDVFGIRLSESNSVSSVTYQRDTYGNCTNETITVAGGPQSSAAAETYTIDREFDAHSRLVRHGDTYYTYAPDGLLATISNAEAVVEYAYTPDRLDAGYTLTLTNGTVFSRAVVRDTYRRSLITTITNSVNGVPVDTFAYTYDALGRPISRNSDSFGYNDRSEVTSAILHSPFSILHSYGYDDIGNSTNWPVNCLNQYTAISGGPTSVSAAYDLDGNMLTNGVFTYAYDAANRLASVSSNGVVLATYSYDAQGRRVKKVATDGTHRYFYDGWLLIREHLTRPDNTVSETQYCWGTDMTGTLQGAGGVGGLLYLTVSNSNSNSQLQLYVPFYDNNGNITHYCDANGNIVAYYTYDAFGNLLSATGLMADFFRHRFSTKYYDAETGLYYYGYRFYCLTLMRWLNRDPIEEGGGNNLYAFCVNNGVCRFDPLGNFSLNLYWRELTGEERREIKMLAAQITQKCDSLITSIANFYLHDFPQAIPAPEVGFVQPREIDRSADISKLDDGLVEFFMLREHRNQGSLNWALSQLKWRLAEEKKIAQFDFYRMSTCRNILCYAGIEALKTPLFIGFCKKQWDQEDVGTKRALLAHEASHMFHSTLDLYYREGGDPLLPFNRLRDAYAWGLLFAY